MSWNGQGPSVYNPDMPSTNPYGNFTVVDTVPKEILHMIPNYWYQFPPLNPLWYALVALYTGTMGLLSVVGNFIVIWVFSNTKSLRTPANLMVVNLAMADFTMMFCMCPPAVINCYYGTWVFSGFFCEIYAMVGSICGVTAIWTMVFITLDRYNVIVKGVAATPLSNGGAIARNLFAWVFGTAWCLPPLFGWCRYVPEGNMAACGTDYLSGDWFSDLYIYLYSVYCYFGPFILACYCYAFIISAVSKHEKSMREQAKKMGVKSLRNEESQKTSAECRLAKIAMMNMTLWFIAWTPYCISNYAGMLGTTYVTPLTSIWGAVFAKASAVYNPIIYAISHPKYRAAMEKKIPCLACKNDDYHGDNSSSATGTEKTESA